MPIYAGASLGLSPREGRGRLSEKKPLMPLSLQAKTTRLFTSFEEIADNYSVIFFDAFGVLKSSEGVFPGVAKVLHSLKRRGKEIFVLTNDSSRSPALMSEAYAHPEYGNLVPDSRIVSSGLLATEYLRNKVRSGWVTYLGKEASAYYIELAGLKPVPISECTEDHSPKALVLLDDEGFDWFRDINRAINLVRQYNVPVVVANDDLAYPVNMEDVAVAVGGLANVMEAILKKAFIRFGKPDALMFSYAYAKAQSVLPSCTKREVLMVGDTLRTDILGANKFGIDTALVLSGNIPPDAVEVAVRSSGITPTYVCESILT